MLFLLNVFAVLPAIMFYFWIVGFGLQAYFEKRSGQTRQAAICLAAALVPCLLYAADYAWASFKYHRVASITSDVQNQPKLDNPPRTLVIHGASRDDLRWQGQLVEMGAFDEVYLIVHGRVVRLTNERRQGCANQDDNVYRARTGFLVCATEANLATQAPMEGLHLYLGKAPRSPAGPLNLNDVVRSNELRVVAGNVQQTIGLSSSANPQYPFFPPMLWWGSFWRDGKVYETMPRYSEVSFIIERLDLPPDAMKPRNLPSPAEVRAEFIRLRDSADSKQQRFAGLIATAVGASALSADDVEPVMMSNAIHYDLASEIGFQQFCGRIDRLCDFQDRLVSVCKVKRTRDRATCDRLPQQCAWCKQATLCRPYVTGRTAGCAPEEIAIREASLKRLKEP